MAARTAPKPSQDGDQERRARRGLPHLALHLSLPRLKLPRRAKPVDTPQDREPAGDKRAWATLMRGLRRAPAAVDGAGAAVAEAGIGPPAGSASRWSQLSSWRPTPFVAAVGAVIVALAFVSALTYYGAQTFTRRAANDRAANEAQSFTIQSAKLANNDAFDAYVQILRYADDPVLNDKNALTDRRVAIMQQDLYLYVNKFASLSIATRSGDVLASTDPSIRSVRGGQAFVETRANLNPANSDIVIATPGQPGFIEYTTPLHEPDGAVWGILVARADPARLWGATLAATIDGGRNVIINNNGLFAAGVPDELIGQPWQGSPLSNGGVRANIAGVDSICGLALIGKGTQIDKGLNVASCMPVSLIQSEQSRAMGKQGLVTIAGAIFACVLAAGAMTLLWHRPQPAAAAAAEPPVSDTLAGEFEALLVSEPPPVEPVDEPQPEPEPAPAATDEYDAAPAPEPVQLPPPVIADVDALTLIEAYEARNARLADRLRETIQARLLVAASQADEAYRLAATDTEAAARLHRHALDDLERIRTAELRALGQELHPALVRLGLPAALKALSKELAGVVAITLDVDATVDSLVTTPGRSMLPPQLRLALYRLAMDAVRALAAAGAGSCGIELGRRDGIIVLAVSGATGDERPSVEDGELAAGVLAIEAHGGTVSMSRHGGTSVVAALIASPPVAEMPEGWVPPPELDEEDAGDDVLAALTAEPPYQTEDLAGEDDDAEDDGPSPIRTFIPPDESDAAGDAEPDGEAEMVELVRPNLHIITRPPEPAPAESGPLPPSGRVPIDAIHLGGALEEISMTPRGLNVSLDLDLVDGGETLVPGLRATVFGLVEAIVAELEASGAARCTISVRQAAGEVMLSAISETDGTPFDASSLKPFEAEIEAFGGYLAVSRRDNAVSVTAEVTAVTLDGASPLSEPFEGLLDGEGASPDDDTLAS